ncbi:biotin/lipoyl-binding protein, partial [Bacteroidales bacterium OttesenSCG-928-E04]|nr:biotin/lipoyl-binding protein [Bacteroidales bacterium OttesenSCG-928-E04]
MVVVVVVLITVFAKQHKELLIRTETVKEGKLEITVMATGYINPVEEVEVGTQVSGVIENIYADYNSHVKKGQLLAELDKLTLQEKVNMAQASLVSAQSDMDYAKQNYERVKKLFDSDAATLVSYQDALNKFNQAKTNLENAESNLSSAKVNLSY